MNATNISVLLFLLIGPTDTNTTFGPDVESGIDILYSSRSQAIKLVSQLVLAFSRYPYTFKQFTLYSTLEDAKSYNNILLINGKFSKRKTRIHIYWN